MTRGKRKKGKKVGSDRGEKMGLEKMLDAEKVGGPIYRMTSNIGLLAAWYLDFAEGYPAFRVVFISLDPVRK